MTHLHECIVRKLLAVAAVLSTAALAATATLLTAALTTASLLATTTLLTTLLVTLASLVLFSHPCFLLVGVWCDRVSKESLLH